MKFRSRFIVLVFILLFVFAIGYRSVQAQQPEPKAPDTPLASLPALPELQETVSQAEFQELAALPPLKAVLIVGPLGASTQAEINNMELAANALQSRGVQVLRFYTPNDRWSDIVSAANGAHFLLYRGHGLYWNGDTVTPQVGGFELTEKMYSNDEIKRDLKLAPNAIVMFFACFATGSSTTDQARIPPDEARRRISQYAQPFFDLGAAGFYANWYGDAFQVFINNLFNGMTLENAFKNYPDFEAAKSTLTTNQAYTNLPLWLSWETWTDYGIPPEIYNNTFTGQANKTLNDLFKPTITLSTKSIAYITKPSAAPRTYQVTVQSNTGATFSWVASPAGGSSPSWVTYTPTSGSNGTVLNITLTPPASTGRFETSLVVKSADGSIQESIAIMLITMTNPKTVFMPNVTR